MATEKVKTQWFKNQVTGLEFEVVVGTDHYLDLCQNYKFVKIDPPKKKPGGHPNQGGNQE